MMPAGHVATIDPRRLDVNFRRFWNEDQASLGNVLDPDCRSETDQFAALFEDSVTHRLVSDVPVGTFNSGGVDSSLVTRQVRAITDGELHTFSVGFDEASYDERQYAETVSTTLGTHHHTLVMNRMEYADALETTIWHLDEPLGHAHSVQLLKLSQFAKQFVTVVLTGEGADETFAGYPRYQIPMFAHAAGRTGAALKGLGLPVARALGLRRGIKLLENADSWEASVLNAARFVDERTLRTLGLDDSIVERRRALLEEIAQTSQNFLEKVLE